MSEESWGLNIIISLNCVNTKCKLNSLWWKKASCLLYMLVNIFFKVKKFEVFSNNFFFCKFLKSKKYKKFSIDQKLALQIWMNKINSDWASHSLRAHCQMAKEATPPQRPAYRQPKIVGISRSASAANH